MSTKSRLVATLEHLNESVMAAMLTMANAARSNSADEDDLPAPRIPGRSRRVSQENDDEEQTPRGRGRPRKEAAPINSAKRGRGRPRKEDAAPAKRSPGRPRKDDSDNRPAPRKAAPAVARNSGATDYSEMSKAELRDAAAKIGLVGTKDANLSKALIAIEKLANGSKSVASWEKQAKSANVELVFGRGRPPATDEGLRRRIIVKMVNERALRV